jgi:transposase
VIGQRTSVGLDVHARSVVGCGLDGQTGELLRTRLTPAHEQVIGWLRSLPGPIKVTYEAGPTGFGLARALAVAGIDCVVAAPSRLLRPTGDRVKTDAKDALHLARLLAVGEVTAVAVPDEETEAARDLVRARDDVRGELMSARHRVTHLLLRQGIVYSGGTPWTRLHEDWLRRQRFARPALQSAYDAALESLAAALARRDRLDEAIAAMAAAGRFTPVVDRLACLRGVATLTGFALAVEIGDWQRLSGATIGSYLGLVPTEDSTGQSRSQGGVTKTGNSPFAGCWSRRPGSTAPPTGPRRICSDGGSAPRPRSPHTRRRATGGCTPAGDPSTPAASARWWPTPRSPASWPAGAGRWPSWTSAARPADRHPARGTGHVGRPSPARASPGTRRGQRRSCSLRCACSTLTLPALPENAAVERGRMKSRKPGPGSPRKRPLMSTGWMTAA